MDHSLLQAAEICRKAGSGTPDVAIVLGSGLGGWADRHAERVLSFADLPDMPVSTVTGHAGRFVFGTVGDKRIAVMQGRVHYYEGYTPQQIVWPIRLLAALGARTLVLTNAAGGVNESFRAGDLMLITDHILCIPSPLVGPNDERFGTRFPDMTNVYDAAFRARILSHPAANDLRQGVYLQTSGPQYETPAEIRMFRTFGADAVGMSTAVEAVAARHAGLTVAGVSCITNLAAGMSGTALDHSEVNETAARTAERFSVLLDAIVSLAE